MEDSTNLRPANTRRRRYFGRSEVNMCVKYFLFFTNFPLFLAGGVALGLGMWIQMDKSKVVVNLVDFLFDPSLMLMCLGGTITFVVAFFGCSGSLRENVVLLTIYHVLVTGLLLMEVGLVMFIFIFYFSPQTLKTLDIVPEDTLRHAIINYREDSDMQDLIDGIQETMGCCGIRNTKDGYKDWTDNMYFNCSPSNPSHERCSVPYSCCILNPGDMINILCGNGALERSEDEVKRIIHTDGCLYSLGTWIDRNALIAAGSTLGIFIPQVIAICYAKQLKDQIKAQKSKWLLSRL